MESADHNDGMMSGPTPPRPCPTRRPEAAAQGWGYQTANAGLAEEDGNLGTGRRAFSLDLRVNARRTAPCAAADHNSRSLGFDG